MEEVPDFWRTEILHPLSVHFPIALLLVALVFKITFLAYRTEVWEQGGRVLLIIGVVGVWIAIFTGDLADGVVSRSLCDPTVLKEHENFAWITAWIFTAALAVDLLRLIQYPVFKSGFFIGIVLLLLTAGSGTLIYVGHLGAELVYQQAAGVNVPSADCAEFE